ncbi:MAG TPA: FlgO family outer membrane protein [Elusimicrobiales bacterium]|nr:FlgO family outer membrane protein [Elusimicrobiales bacterium]
MTATLIAAVLFIPALAQAERPSGDTNKTAPVTASKAYGQLAGELLKDLTGADKAIAVAGFSYSDGRDSRDGNVVAERITAELVKAQKVKVIERKEIEKVFQELKLQRSGIIDSDSARNIGKMLGADWVVVGTLTELPDAQLELNARLVGAGSGEIVNAAAARLEKDWVDQYSKTLDEKAGGRAAPPAKEAGNDSAKAKLENITIPNFKREVAAAGGKVTVKVDFDSFAYDEEMLRRVGSEVLPAIMTSFKGSDRKVFANVNGLEIKLNNSFPQTAILKSGKTMIVTVTNKIGDLGDNVRFRISALGHEKKKAKK